MKKLLLIIGFFTSLSCTNKVETKIESIDQNLQLYNDILVDLVTDHFYYLYLGNEDLENLSSVQIESLRKNIESDTSKKKSICLRNELSYGPWKFFKYETFADSLKIFPTLKDFMTEVSEDYPKIVDSLKAPQNRFFATDFQPRTFKIASFGNSHDCEIGVISFSKVFLNESGDKGILYYEFVCGEKCGKGEILLLQKMTGEWTIEKKERMWVM